MVMSGRPRLTLVTGDTLSDTGAIFSSLSSRWSRQLDGTQSILSLEHRSSQHCPTTSVLSGQESLSYVLRCGSSVSWASLGSIDLTLFCGSHLSSYGVLRPALELPTSKVKVSRHQLVQMEQLQSYHSWLSSSPSLYHGSTVRQTTTLRCL